MYSNGTWNDTIDDYPFAVGYVVEFDAAASSDDYADWLTDVHSPLGQLAVGTPKTGNIETGDDRDFFKVTLSAATNYKFTLSGQDGGGGSLNNPWLWLHDSKGKLLATHNDIAPGANLDAQINYTAKKAGVYYLQALGYELEETGSYQVTATAVAPEISVTGNGGVNIADNDLNAGPADGTHFGTVALGSSHVHTFTVTNSGNGALTISKLKMAKGFALVEPLDSTIDPNASGTFQVRIDTAKLGSKNGQISFTTNDGDEAVFNFALSGNVTASGLSATRMSADLFASDLEGQFVFDDIGGAMWDPDGAGKKDAMPLLTSFTGVAGHDFDLM